MNENIQKTIFDIAHPKDKVKPKIITQIINMIPCILFLLTFLLILLKDSELFMISPQF